MQAHSQKLFKTIRDFYTDCITQLSAIESGVDETIDTTELADYALALRESADQLEALEKAIRKVQEGKAEKKLAFIHITDATGENLRTQYCVAVIDPTTSISIPTLKNSPEVYFAMCADMGIPQDFAEAEGVRVHYPGMRQWLTDRAAQGLPLPAWATDVKEYNTYRVTLRRLPKRNILDGYES